MTTALVAALMLVASTASAQPTDVDALVQSAVEDFKAKRFGEAAAKFLEARTLLDDPNLDWNIARSFEELGDCANATYWFTSVKQHRAGKNDDRKKVKKNAKLARQKLKVLGTCEDSAEVRFSCADERVRITIDERAAMPCPVTLFLRAGDHALLADLEDGTSERRLLTLKGGVQVDVAFDTLMHVELPTEPVEVPVVEAPKQEAPPAAGGQLGGMFWGGLACAVVGAGGLGASFYFQSVTDDAQADYNTLVGEPTLDDAQRSRLGQLRDDGESNATLANVSRLGGMGLLAVGGTLIVLDLVLADSELDSSVAVVPLPDGAALGWTLVY